MFILFGIPEQTNASRIEKVAYELSIENLLKAANCAPNLEVFPIGIEYTSNTIRTVKFILPREKNKFMPLSRKLKSYVQTTPITPYQYYLIGHQNKLINFPN